MRSFEETQISNANKSMEGQRIHDWWHRRCQLAYTPLTVRCLYDSDATSRQTVGAIIRPMQKFNRVKRLHVILHASGSNIWWRVGFEPWNPWPIYETGGMVFYSRIIYGDCARTMLSLFSAIIAYKIKTFDDFKNRVTVSILRRTCAIRQTGSFHLININLIRCSIQNMNCSRHWIVIWNEVQP